MLRRFGNVDAVLQDSFARSKICRFEDNSHLCGTRLGKIWIIQVVRGDAFLHPGFISKDEAALVEVEAPEMNCAVPEVEAVFVLTSSKSEFLGMPRSSAGDGMELRTWREEPSTNSTSLASIPASP